MLCPKETEFVSSILTVANWVCKLHPYCCQLGSARKGKIRWTEVCKRQTESGLHPTDACTPVNVVAPNKAYRPNAHLLDSVYNGNII